MAKGRVNVHAVAYLPPPIMFLDGINNTGSGHDNAATTWKDRKGTVADAVKVAGNTLWGDKYLDLDGSTYWNVNAPNASKGTVEVVVAVDAAFVPVSTSYWYAASSIFGCELSGSQRDFNILITSDKYFGVGYATSTIYKSNVLATDGLPHTLSYSYFNGAVSFSIDGVEKATFDTAIVGTQVSIWGIGWQKENAATKIKGKIYSVKWYKELLSAEQKLVSHLNNKSYYGI